MCGIVGSLRWNKPDPLALVKAMTETLNHRGPDANAVCNLGPLQLGHTRLKVIDLDPRANQPLADHSKRYWISYNGEIYNYQDLKKDLQQQGAKFQTQSDTEVILEAWKIWGHQCLERLVGMFAFAIWDSKNQELFLCRDRMGEKPLFYAPIENNIDNGIIFASELKALRIHPDWEQRINPKAVAQYLSYNYILSDQCIFEDCHKLPPAHFLKLSKRHSPQLQCYWDLAGFFNQPKKSLSLQQATTELNTLLSDIVGKQMISDVPLGAFLSGGIDSSTIVANMTQQGQAKHINTFSIGFNEKTYSELDNSQSVAQQLGVDHHIKIIDANIRQVLPNILASYDEPFADGSMIPTYFLSQFAREHVTVCLTGDGGDELFAGYETYRASKLYHQLSGMPKIFKSMLQTGSHLLPTSFSKLSFDYKVKQFCRGLSLPWPHAHKHWRTLFEHPNPYESIESHHQAVANCHWLDQALYLDMKTWLVDDILVKVDRASMAHSLETRIPFLDHRLVEWAATLPVHLKLKGFTGKHILKSSQKHLLHNKIRKQKKKGFVAPLAHWLQDKLYEQARDLTTHPLLKAHIGDIKIEDLWTQHRQQKQDNSYKLFGLMNLSHWLQQRPSTYKEEPYDIRHHTRVQ